MALKVDPPDSLEQDQRGVFDRLVHAIGAPGADAKYDALESSEDGKVISVDAARLLSPEFRSWSGRLRHTQSTANPAGAYAHDRLMRELARRRGIRRRLLVTAGRAGSGKTSQLKGQSSVFDLIFDNQLKNFRSASALLAAAVKNSWDVEVVYVHRPFEDVVRAVIERSQRTGRWNRLIDLPAAHIEAQQTIVRLHREFRGRVWVHSVFNASPGTGDRSPGSLLLLRELGPSGRYHLSNAATPLKVIPPILKKARNEGIVSAQVSRLISEGITD